jgi:hypothetical protein
MKMIHLLILAGMFPAPLFGMHHSAIAAIVQNQHSSSSNQPQNSSSGHYSPADMARVQRMIEQDEREVQQEAQWRNIEESMTREDREANRIENSQNNYFNYDNYFDKNMMQPTQKVALQAAAAKAAQITNAQRIDKCLDQTWLGCMSVITCGLYKTSKKSNVIHPAPNNTLAFHQ